MRSKTFECFYILYIQQFNSRMSWRLNTKRLNKVFERILIGWVNSTLGLGDVNTQERPASCDWIERTINYVKSVSSLHLSLSLIVSIIEVIEGINRLKKVVWSVCCCSERTYIWTRSPPCTLLLVPQSRKNSFWDSCQYGGGEPLPV